MFTVDCQPNRRVGQVQSDSKPMCQIAKMQMKIALSSEWQQIHLEYARILLKFAG